MSSLSTATLRGIVLGVGALLILALGVGLALLLRSLARRRAEARWAALSQAAPGVDPATRPTGMMAAVDAVPPAQRARAAKAYRGMPVCWDVALESAFPSGLTTLRLMLTEPGTHYPWVTCDARPRRYPALRGLPKYAPLRVCGRIDKVDINEISFRAVRLEFGVGD